MRSVLHLSEIRSMTPISCCILCTFRIILLHEKSLHPSSTKFYRFLCKYEELNIFECLDNLIKYSIDATFVDSDPHMWSGT